MEIINFIGGICSILGLLISIVTLSKVTKINNCNNKERNNVNSSFINLGGTKQINGDEK